MWRHKLLDAVRTYMGIGNLAGIIEIDETFYTESFKGNHKKTKLLLCQGNPEKEERKHTQGHKS
jgi:hypothetical protein